MHRFLIIFVSIIMFSARVYSGVTFFIENKDGKPFLETSWGFQKGESHLETIGKEEGKGACPVESEYAFRGSNCLRLTYRSSEKGKWGMAIAGEEWNFHDFTQYETLSLMVNAPATIPGRYLPAIKLEDSNNNKSIRVLLSNYIGWVDDDETTWQEIIIPLKLFVAADDDFDIKRIKTIYFTQGYADDTEYTLWVDSLKVRDPGYDGPRIPQTPSSVTAKGYPGRIDLTWTPDSGEVPVEYIIYRSSSSDKDFAQLTISNLHIYSDFFAKNNVTYYYYVTARDAEYEESPPSDIVSATSRKMSDKEFLTFIQEAAFRYFYDFGHPVSGLAREGSNTGDRCAIGGTGFGLMTIMVGVKRGFVSREQAVERLLTILRFLQEKTPRFHGAWSHWVNGATGEVIPFSKYDDGGDLVETSYLVMGLLTIRKFFNQENPQEEELRSRATQLWESVEWDWYRQTPKGEVLYWHWSPKYGWKKNHSITGFNECMITYLLAIASPTHGVPAYMYFSGWASRKNYRNGSMYYGLKIWVGPPYGGPLFFTHYTFMGFDPRRKKDRFCNYFKNNLNITLVNRAYCIENPEKYKGYGPRCWGLTASDTPKGYKAHSPTNDNGTITPTAAISSMPYTPKESLSAMKYFYYHYGKRLWCEFGLLDAFNPTEDWYADRVLAIDQGPIAPMIENYRTGLCWKYFMANLEIRKMLKEVGWRKDR